MSKYQKIELTRGKVAIVDAADYEQLSTFKWHATWNQCTRSFYAKRNSPMVDGKQYAILMHRSILGLERGDKREGDHRNHDTLDNRRSNLRVATHSKNACNRRMYRHNTSGYKGVSWKKLNHKWQAQIKIDGHVQYLGLFDNPESAASAYDFAAIALHGDFATTNEAIVESGVALFN